MAAEKAFRQGISAFSSHFSDMVQPDQFGNFGNCSPLSQGGLRVMQFDHFGGISGERDLDGDERVVSESLH